MSNLFDLVNTVNGALKDSEGFDWAEVDKAMTDIHAKLTEHKWAIEDEVLRDECQKLVVSWAAHRYLTGGNDLLKNSPDANKKQAEAPSMPAQNKDGDNT